MIFYALNNTRNNYGIYKCRGKVLHHYTNGVQVYRGRRRVRHFSEPNALNRAMNWCRK